MNVRKFTESKWLLFVSFTDLKHPVVLSSGVLEKGLGVVRRMCFKTYTLCKIEIACQQLVVLEHY